MTATADVSAQRRALWDSGFRPVPVFNIDASVGTPGKQPKGNGWQREALLDPPPCVSHGADIDALNTGVMANGLRAIDLDIEDADVCAELTALATDMFGQAPMRWRNNSGRRLLVYRAAQGEPGKRSVKGERGTVEVLGKGQQFVAYGKHPSGADLLWTGDLTDWVADDLPGIAEDDLTEFLSKAAKILGADAPIQTIPPVKNGTHTSKSETGLDEIADLLRHVNPDAPYDEWLQALMAVHAATGGSSDGLAVAEDWSSLGSKHKAGEVAKKWGSFRQSGINGGTLAALARNHGANLSAIRIAHMPEDPAQGEALRHGRAVLENMSFPKKRDAEGAGASQSGQMKTEAPSFSPTPYVWRDPSEIPKRAWVYGHHLVRKFVSVTVSPGGIGKSSLTMAEAISMVIGRGFLGPWVEKPLKVWLWNLEDPEDELHRRMAATMMHHRIMPSRLGDRLFLDTGRQQSLCTAVQGKMGAQIVQPVMDRLEEQIKQNGIDVLIVDPFVSSHRVAESDNDAIDLVIKEWSRLADRCNIAIELVHHTRKGHDQFETTAESARGAKALVDGARDVRALNRMTKEEAAQAGVENNRLLFRVFSDKMNLAPPAEGSEWYRLVGVGLPNGDNVGVVEAWKWPDPFDDITVADLFRAQKAVKADIQRNRASVQSPAWVGHAIGEALEIDTGEGIAKKADLTPEQAAGRSKVEKLLRVWLQSGAFVSNETIDENRKLRPIIEVGEWAHE